MASLHGMRLISCVPNSHSILTSKYHPLKFTCRNKEALFFEAYTNYEQKSYSYQSEIDIMYRYLSDYLSSVRHLAHLPISHMMWHFLIISALQTTTLEYTSWLVLLLWGTAQSVCL